MAVTDFIQRNRPAVRQTLEFTRTTVIGGALFLLPIFVVLLVLGRLFGLMGGLTEPIVATLGVSSVGGIECRAPSGARQVLWKLSLPEMNGRP